jgi:cell division protein FtsB
MVPHPLLQMGLPGSTELLIILLIFGIFVTMLVVGVLVLRAVVRSGSGGEAAALRERVDELEQEVADLRDSDERGSS